MKQVRLVQERREVTEAELHKLFSLAPSFRLSDAKMLVRSGKASVEVVFVLFETSSDVSLDFVRELNQSVG